MKISEYKSEPCPICGHKEWCCRREDGLMLCKRPPSPPEGVKDLREWVRGLVPDWQAMDVAAVRQTILKAIKPPTLLLVALPCDRRGRVTIKVFQRDDGVEATPVHCDRLHVEDAAARRRFARAVAKVEPGADVDDLMQCLLALKIPPGTEQKPSPAPSAPEITERRAAAGRSGSPPEGSSQGAGDSLRTVFLPGGPATITQSAVMLGRLLAETGKYYSRGGTVVTVGTDDDGLPVLEPLRPAALASVFESVAKLMEYTKEKGQFVPQEAISSEQDAKLIQQCISFRQLLPPIHLLSRCPVMIERDGELVQISGYDRDSGILAFGEPAQDVPADEAVSLLSDMLADFRFATPADRARALAAIITPALVFGDLLGGRAPVDLGEADASQSGKGYRNKLTAAIYNHTVRTVTQKKGGVGSLEETFCTALIRGCNFISLDNVRGVIDCPAIESFLTEDTFLARAPHLAAVEIDPRRVVLQLTSNKADITTDLANRSSCVRILKQPESYRFRGYGEGDVLNHVRANQPSYLGAVFAVVKAWHATGKPRTGATGHDFRPWASALDWIVQNILKAGPLLAGHRDTQARMATPVLNWLRDVSLAVRCSGHMGLWLRASGLADIIAEIPDVELPGRPEGSDLADEPARKKVHQAIGRRMAQCFGSDGLRVIDGFQIERRELDDPVHSRSIKEYRFAIAETVESAFPYAPPIGHTGDRGAVTRQAAEAAPVAPSSTNPATASVTDDSDPPYRPPMLPLCESPMKTANSPMSPMGSVIAPRENHNSRVYENTCETDADSKKVMEPIGGTAGTAETPIFDPDRDEVLI